jgi:hypothetical protein
VEKTHLATATNGANEDDDFAIAALMDGIS